jgi:protein-S-isoprenylcysteine O-methyltransferase Ste14
MSSDPARPAKPLLLHLRGWLRDVFIVASLLFMNPDPTALSAGLAIFAVGAALHLWSKAALVRNAQVTSVGPYGIVRHPFYLANFLIDFGLCVMSGNPYVCALYLPAYLLAYLPTIRHEERFLREAHGAAYQAYASSTPMLVPYRVDRWFRPLQASAENLRNERELPRLWRLLAVPIYFVIAAEVHYALAHPSALHTSVTAIAGVATVALVLHALAFRSARLLRPRRPAPADPLDALAASRSRTP